MSEDYVVVNLDKRQLLSAETLGASSSLRSLLLTGMLPNTLTWLLVDRQPLVFGNSPLRGSWIGDRVVVASDGESSESIHLQAVREFRNITIDAFEAIAFESGPFLEYLEVGILDDDGRFVPGWMNRPPPEADG